MEHSDQQPLLQAGPELVFPGADFSIDSCEVDAVSSSSSSVTSLPDTASVSHLDDDTYTQQWQYETLRPEDDTVLQACVFLEDAFEYRTINHKVDRKSLKLYRLYYTSAVQWFLYLVIALLHMLAFIETPSSLSVSSDLRVKSQAIELTCGITESIEMLCLLVLLADAVFQIYVKGFPGALHDRWLVGEVLVLALSFVDWFVSIATGCPYHIRIRRMVRPYFLLHHSRLMKKTVKALQRSMPQVLSVLLLLGLHIYFFTLFGMLLFPKEDGQSSHHKDEEFYDYFNNLTDSFLHMLVLLTTANTPDITLPAYNTNRLYIIFFIIFIIIGVYCLMNMVMAVIYNQFRGYFMTSMQSSLFRKRVGIRAAFEILRQRKLRYSEHSSLSIVSSVVPTTVIHLVVNQTRLRRHYKFKLQSSLQRTPDKSLTFTKYMKLFIDIDQENFDHETPPPASHSSRLGSLLAAVVMHPYFIWFGCLVTLVNVIVITAELAVEYDKVRSAPNTYLGIVNLFLIPYYVLEVGLSGWAIGWAMYLSTWGNILDVVITTALALVQGVYLVLFGSPFHSGDTALSKSTNLTLWDLARIINMLILLRLARIATSKVKTMHTVATTMLDLVVNLKAFAGLVVIIYYFFALVGMVLLGGKITYSENSTEISKCGTFEELGYWSNNFDDFASSIVVLFNLMVVNNWQVFLSVYARYYSPWTVLFFICWWVIAVVIALSLFTALILENFIMHWDEMNKKEGAQRRAATLSVHDMFRDSLQEPSDDALLAEIQGHLHLQQLNTNNLDNSP